MLICILSLLAFPAPAGSPITLAIDTQSPGYAIPTNYCGLSLGVITARPDRVGITGYLYSATNTQLITLFRNIGLHSLRLGGETDLNTTNLDNLFAFAQAANVQVIYTLRLLNGSTNTDAELARYIWTNYQSNLDSFSIGNEPDIYRGSDPDITNYTTFLAKWRTFAAAVSNAVPGARFAAPDPAGKSWALLFANDEKDSGRIAVITQHFYIGGKPGTTTVPQAIDNMLSTNWLTSKYAPLYDNTLGPVLADGLPYRFTEADDYLTGISGASDSFSAALWALDYLYWWAEHQCSGVNFQNSTWLATDTFYLDNSGDYQIHPKAYGIKAFNVGSQGNLMPLAISNAGGLNLTAYAVGNPTNLYVTIINKEHGAGGRDADVTIIPDGYSSGTAAGMFLVAPDNDIGATAGVTLGGATIANNAPWAGTWAPLMSDTNGRCLLTVPAASAVVVRIDPAGSVAAPQIGRDLPMQVTAVSGKSYTYTVQAGGTIPLSYQWYNGTTPIAGATGPTYTLDAFPGEYRVVITNAYGAVTSSVSVMRVLTPGAGAYAKAVVALGPAGYWPLQETGAPAPANMETNYGTLGGAANAYYAGATAVAFHRAGGLAGDTDYSVAFAGGGGNPNSYAFVPRLASALTFKPPFSLEAWMNPAWTNYGVLLGEGGGTSLNGGPTFGGFQFAWGGNNSSRFDMQLYQYGSNVYSAVHTPEGYALDAWHHYVVTYDTSSNVTLYIDGQYVTGGTLAYTADSWSPFTIGAGKWNYNTNGAVRWFHGNEDEVAVYTNLLSPTTVAIHYAAGISSTSNYFQTVLADQPLLYYRMDLPACASTDPALFPAAFNFGSAPANGVYLPGTVPGGFTGPPVLTSEPAPVACPINGVISCVDAGCDPAFNPTGTQPFTAMIWFRTYPADGRTQAIMSHGADTSWALSLIGTNGTVIFSTGAGGSVMSTNILNDAQWHQVAGVYDGSSNYLYVDGRPNNSSPATGAIAGNTLDDVFLGGDPDYTAVGINQRYFAGAIAQAAFFTNALTPGQVQQLYTAANTPVLSLAHGSGNNLAITYTGILLSSTNMAGPYTAVTGATNPYVFAPTPGQTFYRSSNR